MFNRSKKDQRDIAILRAITDGEIEDIGQIGVDNYEEMPLDQVDRFYCIDIEGEAI